jgi:hypothetical protein
MLKARNGAPTAPPKELTTAGAAARERIKRVQRRQASPRRASEASGGALSTAAGALSARGVMTAPVDINV